MRHEDECPICDVCDGSGKVDGGDCVICGGEGLLGLSPMPELLAPEVKADLAVKRG